MRNLILFAVILTVLGGCKRDAETDITGVVIEQQGCSPDSYVVQIVGGDTRGRSFICTDAALSSSSLNCGNAVFIRLPEQFRVVGMRIRFVYTGTLPSCLSWSFAPKLITVESLRAD